MEKTVKLVLVLSLLISFCNFVTCYTCETPEYWLREADLIQSSSENEVSSDNVAAQNIRTGQKWLGGIIPYKFHHSLTLRDIAEVRSAFEEYEGKTCIKFQPWKEGDHDFLSIEVNASVCGLAHVCKQGGYQFAQFGSPSERCRNKATIIHELGHTICLGHEQERFDRDKYLGFSNCDSKPRKGSDSAWTATGIYDYSSQLHYECNADKANMYNFGYKLKAGTPLYPCRAPVRWEVSPGRYDIDTKSCHIGGWEQTFVVTEDVEVLTIPGGLNNKCSIYKLRNRADATRENGVVSSLSFRYTEARGYVAYGTLTTNDVTENALGKIWLWGFHNSFQDFDAELQVGSVTAFQRDYKVLTCSLDETCVMKTMFEKRNECTHSFKETECMKAGHFYDHAEDTCTNGKLLQLSFVVDITNNRTIEKLQEFSDTLIPALFEKYPLLEIGLTTHADWPGKAWGHSQTEHNDPEGCYTLHLPLTKSPKLFKMAASSLKYLWSDSPNNGISALTWTAADTQIGWNRRAVGALKILVLMTDASDIGDRNLITPEDRTRSKLDGTDHCSKNNPTSYTSAKNSFAKDKMALFGILFADRTPNIQTVWENYATNSLKLPWGYEYGKEPTIQIIDSFDKFIKSLG